MTWCGCCGDKFGKDALLRIRPWSDRGCTDLPFLLLFALFFVGMIGITSDAIDNGGDPNRIIRGVNMQGKICGVDEGYVNQDLAAWPWPADYKSVICVDDCSATDSDPRMSVTYSSTKFLFYCVPTVVDYSSTINGNTTASDYYDSFSSYSETAARAVGDVYTAAPIIGASAPIALVMAMVYMMFVKSCAGAVIWVVIFGIAIIGTACGVAILDYVKCFLPGDESIYCEDSQGSYDPDTAESIEIFGYGVLGCTALYLLIIFCLRKRIQIAIEVVKEAARAMTDMPIMILFPVIPFVIVIGFLVYWVIAALYIYSISNLEDQETDFWTQWRWSDGASTGNPAVRKTFVFDEEYKYALLYHFFALLWNVQFMVYFTFMVIAGAVADWYFTPRDDEHAQQVAARENQLNIEGGAGPLFADDAASHEPAAEPRRLGHCTVWQSCFRNLRFHLGTVAFASLIIAIIQFIRAIVKYMEEKTKSKNNRLQKMMFCLIQCCLKCVECCMDKVSKNAMIWTSVWGDSFIPAVCSSFALIFANLARLAVLSMVGPFLMFLGKILVALATTAICCFIMLNAEPYKSEMSNVTVPGVFIFIFSYFVAQLFMTVFDTAIDTIFLCFLIDEEKNNTGVMLASPQLQALVMNTSEESRKIAEKIKAPPGGSSETDENGQLEMTPIPQEEKA